VVQVVVQLEAVGEAQQVAAAAARLEVVAVDQKESDQVRVRRDR
jgi:hypothetical protein